jgi:hypothetical protein
MKHLLEHNSASMKTEVETYIIEETQELIYDNEKLDQWNKRVAELGLVGQTKIQTPDKSPIPFLHMKETLAAVFGTLCPRKVKVHEYDKTPIPVEILDLIALSVNEKYFNQIEIWYDDKTPDPACIGSTGKWHIYDRAYNVFASVTTESEAIAQKADTRYYGHHFIITGQYLIGRWADVKQSLEELAAKAKKLFIADRTSTIEQNIRDERRKLEDLEHDANVKFGFEAETGLPF